MLMTKAGAILVATAFAVNIPIPYARAQEPTWKILPIEIDASSQLKQIKRGSAVLKQRLVPKTLAVLKGDAKRADGKDNWAKAGDQLFGANIDGVEAFCILRSKANLSFGMFLVPKTSNLLKQNCFVDSDGDGMLDKRFTVDPGIGVLPNVSGSSPKNHESLSPVGFTVIDSREFSDDSWVAIQYRGGGTRKKSPPRFRIRYRYNGKTRSLSAEIRGKSGEFPQSISILGSTFVLKLTEKQKLSVEILKPMNSDFGVTTSIVYY